ncbi:DUF2637 domain-containing protein [Streptomyces sp. AK02-04a]|uniref:DUF2637 domain-containing protein n=1 Tax=Streptomyces sp. AK02-04a TaxID=3028649 RepID=UPI0029A4C731|nr:DUF2637 domain-containing protein [Streptomyces sp. AK02-04a]MDX3763404.1 DUF2637 domain-containing protein [Streptomyces sp. AK02-04a]
MGEFQSRYDPYAPQFTQGVGYDQDVRYDAPQVQHCTECSAHRARHCWHTLDTTMAGGVWDPDVELAQMLNMEPGMNSTRPRPAGQGPHTPPVDQRQPLPRYRSHASKRRIRPTAILIVAIVACTASMLGWSISYSYEQLHAVAALVMPEKLARWWPWMLYGPWLAAGMSIMRASLRHRTARWSWTIIVTASVASVALCIGNSSKSTLMMAISGIPPLTALACFQELVTQCAYRYRPQHAMHSTKRPRQS